MRRQNVPPPSRARPASVPTGRAPGSRGAAQLHAGAAAGVVAGPEAVAYARTPTEELQSLRREIVDHQEILMQAREAREKAAVELETLRHRISGLRRLRDARKGEE
ncbi:MAG: hypothetical protein WBA90_10285 [Albidovulum sp.]